MRVKPILFALFVALPATLAPVSFAEDTPQPEAAVNPRAKQLARRFIEEILSASHIATIYEDGRRTLREVYIPALRDMVQGDVPGVPAPDAKGAAALAKVLTFADYLRKAGDELDLALSENKEAMISDASEEIAKTATPVEIEDVEKLLQLPAVQKALDAFYAASKLLTGFSYNDSRTFAEFSAWAKGLNVDIQQMLPGAPGSPAAVPSKRKIARAQTLVNDLLITSHLEEMIADAKHFVRDVYAESARMSEEERENLREQADQWEFTYNMQKAIALAAAPSIVAAALTDEQLNTLHEFVRSPAVAKAFDLLRNAVKTGTSFTNKDISEAQNAFDELEKKSKLKERSSEDQAKAKADWDALIKKWTEVLKNRISPETRSGLQHSLDDLQNEGLPI
ncbi:MAG: hypothetical protein WBX25_18900 [Rhodomicrobium sp.]